MITLLGHPYTISVPVNFMKRVPVNFAECVTTKLGYSFGDPRGKLQLMIFSLPPSLPKKKKMYVFCSFLEICIIFIFLNVSYFSLLLFLSIGLENLCWHVHRTFHEYGVYLPMLSNVCFIQAVPITILP